MIYDRFDQWEMIETIEPKFYAEIKDHSEIHPFSIGNHQIIEIIASRSLSLLFFYILLNKCIVSTYILLLNDNIVRIFMFNAVGFYFQIIIEKKFPI